LENQNEIFHVVYDLDDRVQIPGTRYIWGWRSYTPAPFATINKGRIVVAICHNSDVCGAWEWADSAQYAEGAASLTYRIGINYVIHGTTH
jgi:hypothetical protein